jgi:serine/threonine protein kinase
MENIRTQVKRIALTEARILKRLRHPHIVGVKATYQDGYDVFAILTSPVATYDLREYLLAVELRRKGPVNGTLGGWQKVSRISPGCLANAVNYLHGQGIQHGNISLENIIVEPDHPYSKICLANFGFAAFHQYEKDMREFAYGTTTDGALKVQQASRDIPE